MYNFCLLFLLFIIYSFLGYIVEIIASSCFYRKLILNRGFFLGPYLPIYGVCCILMTICLQKYKNDLIVLFILATVLCSIIEFFTSYVLEKIFKIRWWDYSQRRFNLDGRICITTSVSFGLGGVILIHFIHPFIMKYLQLLSPINLEIISIILMIIFVVDMIISIVTLCKIKVSSNKYVNHDATEEIKDLTNKILKQNSFYITRLLNAFPKISGKNMKKVVALKKLANDFRQKLKSKVNKKTTTKQ